MKIEIDDINAVLSLLFSTSLINTKEIIGSESQSIVGKDILSGYSKWSYHWLWSQKFGHLCECIVQVMQKCPEKRQRDEFLVSEASFHWDVEDGHRRYSQNTQNSLMMCLMMDRTEHSCLSGELRLEIGNEHSWTWLQLAANTFPRGQKKTSNPFRHLLGWTKRL